LAAVDVVSIATGPAGKTQRIDLYFDFGTTTSRVFPVTGSRRDLFKGTGSKWMPSSEASATGGFALGAAQSLQAARAAAGDASAHAQLEQTSHRRSCL
jgi:hypothetical protein